MTNPFENENSLYYVLLNEQGQYSLWPQSIDIPSGWRNIYGADNKANCKNYIEENWKDMRPISLCNVMKGNPDLATNAK